MSHSDAALPDLWPSRAEISIPLDVKTSAVRALELVTEEDFFRTLKRGPVSALNHLAGVIGMRSLARMNRGLSNRLLSRLRQSGDVHGLFEVLGPAMSALWSDAEDHDAWRAFLQREPNSLHVHDQGEIISICSAISAGRVLAGPSLERLVLVTAVVQSPNPVVALTMLAALDEGAARTHRQLRAAYPAMPEVAESLFAYADGDSFTASWDDHDAEAHVEDEAHHQLTGGQGGLDPMERDGDTEVGGRSAGAEAQEVAAAEESHPAVAPDATSLEDLEQECAALDWAQASVVALRVVEQIDDLCAPDVNDLDYLTGFATSVREIAQDLALRVGGSVQAAATSLEEAVSYLRAQEASQELLDDLTLLQGPEQSEQAISAVRDLARQARAGQVSEQAVAALVALRHLIEAGNARRAGAEVDFAKIGDWDAAARAGLPAHSQSLCVAATIGGLLHFDAPQIPEGPVSSTSESAVEVEEEAPAQPGQEAAPVPAAVEPEALSRPAEPKSESESESVVESQASPEEGASNIDVPAAAPMIAAEQLGNDNDEVDEDDEDALLEALRLDLANTSDPDVRTRQPSRGTPPPLAPTAPEPTGPGPEDVEGQGLFPATRVAEARLLAAGRFGLAAELHTDSGHHRARAMAAYQTYLTTASGPLAAAFAGAAAGISRENLADDRPGQLLAWAAAVRVAVIAPAAGAAAVLTNLAPCVEDLPALTAVGQAFNTAAVMGAFVVPEAAKALSAVDEADTLARDAAERADALVKGAPHRHIKYTPANGVYQAWMEDDADLGRLLRTVATADPARAAEVLVAVTQLRGGADKHIDQTFSNRRSQSNKTRKIIGGARSTLTSLYNDALDVAASWAENARAAAEQRSHWGPEDRSARPLDNLRGALAPVRLQALEELDAISAQLLSSNARLAAEAAAAQAASEMLTVAFSIADGHPPSGLEPTPAFALRGELLATDLTLDPTTLEPLGAGPDELAQAIVALAEAPVPQPDTYRLRASRGEHELTEVLLDNLVATSPQEAAELAVLREADVAAMASQTASRIAKTDALVRVSQRDATLPDDTATTLAAQLEALAASARRDYGRINAELDAIAEVVHTNQVAQVAEARATIEQTAAEVPAVAEHRALLTKLVDNGEVAGALEYLEQLVTLGRLPDPHVEDAHLRRFFPQVPALAAENKKLLVQIRDFLDNGADHADVRKLAEIAQVDLGAIPEASRKAAARAIGAWGAGLRKENVTTVLRPVLALAGFEFANATTPAGTPQQGRQWVRLTGVTAVGNALAPALGSQMSAGGNSMRVLVVTKPTSPTTVADWLRAERQEDTVLVIHLPGAYSPSERVSLANVSRGRARPVIIVIDPAVIAYLAIQPEPSRATLAALTLPFTADSPYRDRAGKTAPEMFYGRSYERREVLNLEGASFVSGGRQLGKSALLWSAKDEFERDATASRRAVLLEVRAIGGHQDPEQLWPRLMSVLVDADIVPSTPATPADGVTVCASIRTWLDEDTERRLLILLDEADLFLEADASNNRFANISLCKNLMDDTGRRVKFVFAGLHRTSRFESLPNQPLAHLGRPIVVGPLRPQAAHDLLTRPLSALGFTFEDPRLQPARILAVTNNVPSLLQLFGQSLMKRLTSREIVHGPPTIITDDDITAVLEDTNLQDEFRRKYLLTLDLDNRYKVIVYAVAYNALENGVDTGVSLSQLEETCRFFWPEGFAEVNLDHLRGLVAECCDLGVLANDQGRIRMRTQTMLRLLGTLETIEETLTDAPARLSLPSSSDVEFHRVPLTGSANRSALTSRQVSQILAGTRRCFTVAGTPGLGVQWVTGALDQLEHDGASRGRKVSRLSNLTVEGIRTKISRTSEPALLVADLRNASAQRVQDVTSSAGEALAETRADIVVVVVADHTSILSWSRVENLIELGRVNAPGLRLWCEEANAAPFLTPFDQSSLLAETGGWPLLITKALNKAASSNTGSKATLGWVRDSLAERAEAITFATNAGILSESSAAAGEPATAVLGSAFLTLADLTAEGGESPEDIIAVLELAEGPGDCDLGVAAARAGFRDTEEVLLALRRCGALRVASDGTIAAEPVLLRAVRVALSTGVQVDQ